MEKKWTDYLSQNAILRTLCKWRAGFVKKRAPLQRLWAVVKGEEEPVVACPDNVTRYLPPRRRWIRLGSKEREKLGEDRLLENTIFRTALRDLSQSDDVPTLPWSKEFRNLQSEIELLRTSRIVKFQSPTLHLVPKSKGAERRCLASFDTVSDRLLLSKAALYLRDTFDPLLGNDCFAFRRDGAFNYRSAIEDLVRYRMEHAGKKIYVAECDIQSFFDVINHDIVLKSYDNFVHRLGKASRPPKELRRILVGYLNAFTSRGNLMASRERKIVDFRHLVKPLEATGVWRFYKRKDRAKVRLGIPQGGALSPLLANIVLYAADRAVREDPDPELFYIRFCDDVIFIHPNRSKCRAALNRYIAELGRLKLPVHPVMRRITFHAKYYDTKSKGPFAWCEMNSSVKNPIPWVSFLGVHVRYDGVVRVRKSSILRHEEQLRREVKRVKDAVGPNGINLKVSTEEAKEALLRAFEARLVAMGTGYSTMRSPNAGRRCWMAAFPMLSPESPTVGQMRHLDSVRGHQVAAIRKQLGLKSGKTLSGRKGYYGRPYSYYGALIDVERHKSYPVDPTAYSKW